jgi:hypothetical protein
MTKLPSVKTIRTSGAYDALLKALYAGVARRVDDVVIPPVPVIAVEGREPPAASPYQEAIAALYGIGYGLKMGLKFGKLPKPRGYFDYKVGALETLWWSTGPTFDITNSATLRWLAYLMVPGFVTARLVEAARDQAAAKHPDAPYDRVRLETVKEARSVQMLHVGPYDEERPTIDALHAYMAEHDLMVAGRHHEIYLSDPRRTRPARLKTVIRIPVRPAQ